MVDMSGGGLLGSVEVEVKANLDKLLAGFAKGKAETQQFDQQMSKVASTTKLTAAEQLNLANSYNQLAKTYDPLKDKMGRYMADAATIKKINESGLFNTKELATLNQGFALLAPKSAQIAAGFKTATGASATLQQQLSGLVAKYNPLQVAQAKYAADLVTVQKAQRAGLLTQSQAVALQGTMARSFEDTTKKIEGETVGLAGWARQTEHHLRAMRLLISFVGIDMAARLGEFVVKTIETTAAIKDQADQLGLTTSQLQEYRLVATQVGMSSDQMDSAFATLGKNIDDLRLGRVGPFSKLIQKLGVDIHDAGGKVLPVNQIFSQLIDKMGQVGDTAQQKGGLEIAFGEAGRTMGQLVQQGSKGVDDMRSSMRAMGLVLSDDQIQKSDETAKKLALLGQALKIEFAQTVTDNAASIEKLALALEHAAAISLQRIIQEVGDLFARVGQLAGLVQQIANMPLPNLAAPGLPMGSSASTARGISDTVGGYYYGQKPATGIIGSVLRAIGGAVGGSLGQGPQQGTSITVPLPAATQAKPKGPNIDLSGILSPKGAKGKQPKYDQFAADMDKELEQQLQIEKEMTGDLDKQNEIEKQIIDLKLGEQIEQIKKQVKNKELTKEEGKQLTAAAQHTADMEKQEADLKTEMAKDAQQKEYADKINQLTRDGLEIAKTMARTDDERKKIDLQILDLQQQQARDDIDAAIKVAEQLNDQTKIAELLDERKKLIANQNAEIKQFELEHQLPIDQFKTALPKNPAEYRDAAQKMAFDKFNEKLQQASQFAGDVGDAFGQAAAEIAQFHKPMDILTNLVSNLAQTFTKNFIEQPVSDWATKAIGQPLAKQAFGDQLNKLAQEAGGTALTTEQMNSALSIATGNLGYLEKAAAGAASALQTIQATAATGGGGAGGGAGGLGSIFGDLLGGAGGGAGADLTGSTSGDILGSFVGDNPDLAALYGFGFASGGFTGSGANGEVKGYVHANEFVLNSGATSAIGVGALSALNSGQNPFTMGAGTVSYAGPPGTTAAPDLADAAAMLMQAAQMLMQAVQGMGGGKGGMGMLGGLIPMALGMFGGGMMGGGGGGGAGGIAGLISGIFGFGSKTPFSGDGAALLGGGSGFGGGSITDQILGMTPDAGLYGMADGGSGVFGGRSGNDRNVLSLNGKPFLRVSRGERFNIDSIASSRLTPMRSANLAQLMGRQKAGDRHFHFGDIVVPDAKDERSARRSGRQALSEIQRGLSQVSRSGLNKGSG